MDRKEYEKALRKKQSEHLKKVRENFKSLQKKIPDRPWEPCLHDDCTECHGTGVKLNGSRCIHMISCYCPKCSKYYLGEPSRKHLYFEEEQSMKSERWIAKTKSAESAGHCSLFSMHSGG